MKKLLRNTPKAYLLAILGGALALILGLSVLIGWFTHNVALIQISPAFVPMQFNTALGFLLSGLGLLLVVTGRYRGASTACGIFVMLMGLLTLTQYILGIDLGIDQLLMQHYITVETSHLGRMAPNTALCFSLTGAALAVIETRVKIWKPNLIAGILGSLVLGLGFIALAGYLSNLETAYGWGSMTRMAVHTASGFIAVSIGIIALGLSKRIDDKIDSLKISLLVGVCTLTLVITLWQALLAHEQIQMQSAIQAEADHLSMQIEQSLNAQILALDRMSRRWEFESDQNTPQMRDKWVADANNYILHQPGYRAIAWADPSFHVRWVVPLQGNEELQGLDLTREEKQRVAVRLAFTSRATVTSRPIELIQGGIGGVVYVPLFNGDNFDGLLVGILHPQGLFDFILSDEIHRGYSIKVFDGNEEIYGHYDTVEQPSGQLAHIAEISFYNTRWQLHIWPSPETAATMVSSLPTLLLTGGGIITLLLMISIHLVITTRLHSRSILLAKQALEAEIDERKQAEKKVARFSQIFEDSLDEIYLFDATSLKFVQVNHAAQKNLGYSMEELQEMTPPSINPDYTTELLEKLITPLRKGKKGMIVFEGVHQRKDKSLYDVEVHLQLLSHEQEELFVAIIIDITDKKKQESILHQAQKMETVGQLTGGIAHDFNNLLSIISGNLRFLKEDLGETSEAIDELFEDATSAVDDGAELTQRLLGFSRTRLLHPETRNVNDTIEKSVRFLSRTLVDNTELATVLPDETLFIDVDPSQLENALLNLCINARDAMTEGGTITISAEHYYHGSDDTDDYSLSLAEGDYVKISVNDTGSGISPEDMQHVYEPFFTTKEIGKGSGLGLSMVFGFTQQSQGACHIDSTLGEGTTVSMYFPEAADRRAIDRTPEETKDLPLHGSEVILVVEDESRVRRVALRDLKKLGYQVLEAENADIARTIIESGEHIDLLFSDILMSGEMNGHMLALWTEEHYPEIKIVLTSGFSKGKTETWKGKVKAPQFPMIRKPYSIEKLARQIKTVLIRVS